MTPTTRPMKPPDPRCPVLWPSLPIWGRDLACNCLQSCKTCAERALNACPVFFWIETDTNAFPCLPAGDVILLSEGTVTIKVTDVVPRLAVSSGQAGVAAGAEADGEGHGPLPEVPAFPHGKVVAKVVNDGKIGEIKAVDLAGYSLLHVSRAVDHGGGPSVFAATFDCNGHVAVHGVSIVGRHVSKNSTCICQPCTAKPISYRHALLHASLPPRTSS